MFAKIIIAITAVASVSAFAPRASVARGAALKMSAEDMVGEVLSHVNATCMGPRR